MGQAGQSCRQLPDGPPTISLCSKGDMPRCNNPEEEEVLQAVRPVTPGESEVLRQATSTGSMHQKCSLSGVEQQIVTAEVVSYDDLLGKLRAEVSGSDSAEFSATLQSVLNMVVNGTGGMIIMVMHEELFNEVLEMEALDGGILLEVLQKIAPDIHKDRDAFGAMLRALAAHSQTDRWEHADLLSLVSELPAAANFVGKLEGQPKDGALLLSHKGVVKGAALHIKYKSRTLQLRRADGTSAGTRHASSLGFAEYLGQVEVENPGCVFTRSDGGGAHAFIPRRKEAPLVLHFNTIHHLSQSEMLSMFRERMTSDGRLMQKKIPTLIRPGIRGETVVTVVDGRVTSQVKIEDDDSFVVQASTPDQEHYVLTKDKFRKNYLPDGTDLSTLKTSTRTNWFLHSQLKQLIAKGFKLYKPMPGIYRLVYTVQLSDFETMVTRCFISAWGAVQPVQEGDFLACPAPIESATEIYLMPSVVLESYEEVFVDGRGEIQGPPLRPKTSFLLHGRTGTCALPEAMDARSQEEMFDLFGAAIQSRGDVYYPSVPSLIRPAVKGETVVTCVNGKVQASTKVEEAGSQVVQGSQHELYVISQEKFEALFEERGNEIGGTLAVDSLLRSQGFKLYRHKQVPLLFYRVQETDLKLMPNGFRSPDGAHQVPDSGDFLVMEAPVLVEEAEQAGKASNAKKPIYMVQEEELENYSRVSSRRFKSSTKALVSVGRMLLPKCPAWPG